MPLLKYHLLGHTLGEAPSLGAGRVVELHVFAPGQVEGKVYASGMAKGKVFTPGLVAGKVD